MAIPLWHLSIVSRSDGGSAVERAAYLFGTTFTSTYSGKTYDHTDKLTEVIYTHIFAPENLPAWVYDPLQLTNSIEQAESRKDAQLVRSIYFALPRELNREQQIALLEDYAQTFVQKGMIAIVAIHDAGTGNPNGHVLLTMRKLESSGKWTAKATLEYVLDANGEKVKLPSGIYKTKKRNTTNWNNRNNVELWRKEWADIINSHLGLAGSKERIDPRSYERQGINKVPTLRLNQDEQDCEKQGIPTPRGEMNRQIRAANKKQKEREREAAASAEPLENLEQERARRIDRWCEQARRKCAPTKEQQAELEEEFYRQLTSSQELEEGEKENITYHFRPENRRAKVLQKLIHLPENLHFVQMAEKQHEKALQTWKQAKQKRPFRKKSPILITLKKMLKKSHTL